MSESESSPGNPLYLVTPVVESKPLGLLTGLNVFLKLENLQPPGSFKCRGISNQCKKAKARGCSGIVCASGGNAGLAAAFSAQVLGLPAHIVLPESTPAFVADKLRNYYGADVQIHGRAWDDANKRALKLCEEQGFEYIHPFDNPDVWDGHTTMIKEAHSQLSRRPDLVIVSVGGGGLFCGVAQGMDEVGWKDVPILAMETYGVDCYNKSVKAGKLFTLDATTSVALCLGARTPCERSFRYYQERPVISEVVPDRDAIHACLRFADDHRMLVEPACGAALAALYSNLIPKLQKEGTLGDVTSVLMIVCGGSGVSLELLQKWKTDFNL